MSELPASKVKQLCLEESEGMRMSAAAIPAATAAAADFLRKVGGRAASVARSLGRKTIMEEDIEAARRQLWGS